MIGKAGVLSRLYLIRHGETAWSLTGQHTGRTDIPLIEQGERDARELAERFRAVSFSRVFTSPLQRARRTLGYRPGPRPSAAWSSLDSQGRAPQNTQTGKPRQRPPTWPAGGSTKSAIHRLPQKSDKPRPRISPTPC
jgi:hypothetical protein